MEAALMFILFVVLILLGMPIAFSLGIASLTYIVGMDIPINIIAQKIYSGMDSFTLVCIPSFILAGNLMNSGGISKRIVDFANVFVGHMRGGLAYVNVFDSMLFAGISGTALADVASLGGMIIPAMVEEGYDADFSVALTASTSVVGPVIPPSVPMVIAGTLTSISIGKLFVGGMLPGIILGLSFLIPTYFISKKRNYPTKKRPPFNEIIKQTINAIPALLMPIILMGGILSGFFTATEASIITVMYSMFVGLFVYKELSISEIPQIFKETILTSASVIFLVGTANIFGWILISERIPQAIAAGILGLTDNYYLIILLMNLVLLLTGMFMESIAAIIIMIPVLLPVGVGIGMEPIHFAIMAIINLMIGLITPPVGLCLSTAAQIAKVPMAKAIKANMPYLAVCLIVLMLVSYFPFFTTYLVQFMN